ncbi:hypothetical protein [Azospirillum canadense]|uniref:hypothetical protein n=1 Tax=Azospirillum canadense TaxID=403962 RepID=UPI002225D4D8|nr:hypothetical protein [Azospirillum canadense]MCW2240353.1 hypothetical protein [Azospirillum canadense]
MHPHRPAATTVAHLAAASLTVSVLASCVGADARREATDALRHAQTLYDQGPNVAEVIQAKITDRPNFGTRAERDRHGHPFPPAWESPGVSFNPGTDPITVPLTLTQIVDRLRLQLRIPVILDLAPPQALSAPSGALGGDTAMPGAASSTPGPDGASSGTAPSSVARLDPASADPVRRLVDAANQPSQGGASAAGLTPAQFLPPGLAGPAAGPDPSTCRVTFPERVMPLSRRLLFIDSTCGVRATYDGQRIVIRRYVEELLPLAAFSGKDDFKSDVGGANSGGGNGGNGAGGYGNGGLNGSSGGSTSAGSQSANSTWAADVYAEVTNGIRARVPRDALVQASPSANGITVVAPPDALDRARAYVDNFNRTASRQINLRIEVLETNLSNSDSFGTDVTLAIKDRWSKLTFAGKGVASNAGSDAGCVTAGVPTTGFFNAVKDIAGTSFTACALAREGVAKVLDSRSFIVPNGGTFTLDESLLNDYVSGGSAGQTTSAGTVVAGSVQTSTTFSGTKLLIQPVLLPDGVVRMRYQPIIQGKPTFVSAGGSADFVQLRRDQSVVTYKQEVSVQNGSTIVAYAAKGDDASTDDAGFGSPRLPLFGGRITGNTSSRAFVIMITPTERDTLGRAPTR